MRNRRLIIGLAAVLAIAIAIPATGADDTLKDALGIAKKARKKGRKALKEVRSARVVQAAAPGTVSTDSPDYLPLPDGPSVSVKVPRSGLIEVTAAATLDEDAGAVALFEDGALVPGQADQCGPPAALFTGPDGAAGRFGTPAVLGLLNCGANGAPGPVLFSRPPGRHTYELRYAEGCPCQTASFSNRTLWVAPRP